MKAKLTHKEQIAVDNLLAAVKALPPSIVISVEDFWDSEPNFTVHKRTEPGLAQQVASLRKKSITF